MSTAGAASGPVMVPRPVRAPRIASFPRRATGDPATSTCAERTPDRSSPFIA
jgi:hypothetical protein